MSQELQTRTAQQDYFSVFELPRKLNVDTAALEKQFYAKSRQLHPDRFASKSRDQQEAATEQSSLLNDAYRTLKDPIARTKYLLSLEGVQLEEQSKSATDAARASGTQKKQAVPPELLEEVFELNMQLQEMKMAREMGEEADTDVRQGLEVARASFQAKLRDIDNELRGLWSRWDAAIDSNNDAQRMSTRDQMVEVLNRRNYIRNLVRDVNDALEASQ